MKRGLSLADNFCLQVVTSSSCSGTKLMLTMSFDCLLIKRRSSPYFNSVSSGSASLTVSVSSSYLKSIISPYIWGQWQVLPYHHTMVMYYCIE